MAGKFDITEVLRREESEGKTFDYIRFTVADINGIGRTVAVPRRHAEGAFKNGVSLFVGIAALDTRTNATFTKEVLELHLPNCNFVPCQNTFHEIPWNRSKQISSKEPEDKTLRRIGQVLCETFWIPPYKNGAQQDGCSRYVLRRQLDKLEKLGLIFKSAFEAEFQVFHRDTNEPVFRGMDASSTLRLAEFEDYLYYLEDNFYRAGLDVSSIVVEHGEGQFEYGMEPVDGVRGADDMFLIKQAIKEMSQKLGYLATFMAKPFPKSSTNGLHLNMSLWKKGPNGELVNAFYDANDKNGLSELHRHFIAGLIKHGKAMCAFCCPTSNCYRRMHCFLAPSKIDWGLDDRLAAFRAKSITPSATYVENRLPSGACNPYLATACTIAAGLDGIANKLPLPPPRTEGLDVKSIGKPVVFKPDTKNDKYFPFTLKDAIDALEKDDVIKKAMGEELIRWFIQTKIEGDIGVVEPLNDEDRWKKETELFYEFL